MVSESLPSNVDSGGYSNNQTACTRSYKVIEGDTCDEIGQKTQTSTYQIMSFNLMSSGAECFDLPIGAVSSVVLRRREGREADS